MGEWLEPTDALRHVDAIRARVVRHCSVRTRIRLASFHERNPPDYVNPLLGFPPRG